MEAVLPRRTAELERPGPFVVQQKANDPDRVGRSILPLIGAPVLPMPPHVVEAAASAAGEDHPRHARGLPALRAAITRQLGSDLGLAIDPDRQLLVTHGAMHGLSTALRTVAGPGDEVLIPAPGFFFDGMVRAAGAVPVYVRTAAADGWRWDFDALRQATTDRTRAILVCNPNNPTGYLPTFEDMSRLVQFSASNGLFVISDESYQRFVHDGRTYVPLEKFTSEYDRHITVTSLSKNYAFSGWRVGYIISAPDLIEAMEIPFIWDALYVGHVPQRAAVAAIEGPQDWIQSVISQYGPKRDYLLAAVAATGSLAAPKPSAGVFLYVDCSALGVTGEALEDLFLDYGIAAVSGRFFRGPDHYVRLVYGSESRILDELSARLNELVDANVPASQPLRGPEIDA